MIREEELIIKRRFIEETDWDVEDIMKFMEYLRRDNGNSNWFWKAYVDSALDIILSNGFTWARTKEGDNFWRVKRNRLETAWVTS